MPQTRQLAAIMFTDIVGYTALMGNDEKIAFQILNQNRTLQKPIIETHNGRWIKELGDGVLASFNSVSDAVRAAMQIQEQCRLACSFQLRIGIHQGEIVFEGDDVFGDAVNVASRIQSAAPAGSIAVSETVNASLANKSDINTRFLKSEKLKNIKAPAKIFEIVGSHPAGHVGRRFTSSVMRNRLSKGVIFIFALLLLVLAGYFFLLSPLARQRSAGSSVHDEQSIAVLPFVDMSADKDQEYFSDGLSEELLNLLAKVPDLKVISRTSSFSFKGKDQDVRAIGNALGVGYILEGSVRKSGSTVRITAQLIEARKGTHLWSDTYDRQMQDVFAIQDEIAGMIVNTLKLKLVNVRSLVRRYTENSEAHEDYLKGRYHWNKRTPEDLQKAISYFQEAISREPDYAPAYSGLADTYITLYDYGSMSADESTARARRAAQRALEIDSKLAEAHNSLAHIDLHDWKWQSAEEGFRRAIDLNPSYVVAHHWYALCLTALGRVDEAVKEMQIARQLDPLSIRINADLGMAYLSAGKYDEAIRQEEKTLELDSNARVAYWISGMAYQQKGLFVEAIENFQRALQLAPDNSNFLAALGHAYASSGNTAEATKIADTLLAKNERRPVSPFFIALVYAGLDDKDKAFEWLEKSYEERSGSVRYLKMEPRLRNLRNDPRYTVLMRKVGLVK